MREIKFRIWDKTTKTMYYPTDENDLMILIGDSGFYQVQDHGNFDIKTAKYKDLRIVDSLEDDLILMQFTGMRVEGGKELYEADLCQAKFKDSRGNIISHVGKIEFNECMWCLECNDTGFSINRLHEIEIIGNIWDNPELLNQVKQ